MDRYNLDFTLELTQGSLHNLGDLFLLCRIGANTFLPTREPGKAVIVLRDSEWRLSAREVRLTHDNTDQLVEMLRRLGLPDRRPQVEAADGNPTGWQQLRISGSLTGVKWDFTLELQYGGATGEDAPALRELLSHLLNVAGLAEEMDRLSVV